MYQLPNWIQENPLLFLIMVVWSFIWKGFALWKSAGLRQKWWFIAILLLNTFGVLEIVYLFVVARKYKVEVVEEKLMRAFVDDVRTRWMSYDVELFDIVSGVRQVVEHFKSKETQKAA